MAGTFELLKNDAGAFRFNLKAGNGQIILSSESYGAKAGALGGIESVRKHAPNDARYERKTAKDGSPYFVLNAANGQTIGRSEMYSAKPAMENGIASVEATAPTAGIKDSTA